MTREEQVQAYMDRVTTYCKGVSEQIVGVRTDDINRYASATPLTKRAKETTLIRLEALTRLLNKHRQLELF